LLELQLQGKLQLARNVVWIALIELTEGSVTLPGSTGAIVDVVLEVETGRVGDVESLCPKLQLQRVVDWEVLEQREVYVAEVRPIDRVAARAADCALGLALESAWVEPVVSSTAFETGRAYAGLS